MSRVEYKTIVAELSRTYARVESMDGQAGEAHARTMRGWTDLLAELGAGGWELIAAIPVPPGSGCLFTFKRITQEGTDDAAI